MQNPRVRRYQGALTLSDGFTLIELMFAVAIVGMLAVIATNSYRSQVLKSHRVDAKNAVLDLAAREEKYFATHNTYSIVGTDLNYSTVFPVNVNSGGQVYYTLSVTQTTTSDFTVTATPAGKQTSDGCSSYILNNLGVQSNGTGATETNCW
ncbi:type IV pilin protein [Undibacterium sp.]|jgi:type IV pilus assembly protein PilE|uniref:type IV pilin protein n=1 Tax=Undibacterium sp. TaxID=1914977 RepID=UPI002BEC0418|nr:type IV pilin protein [Undibacterium sp.]HTD02240.1 type IV pilin protein [Undibacterium sp.]